MNVLTETEIKYLEKKAKEIRSLTIEMIGRLGVGHIGGSLSIIDALVALYYHEMKIDPKDPKWVERDHFILSKGHGGPGVYAVLADKGFFPREWISTLNQPNTNLPSHCDKNLTPGIDMTAGSLGQGLSAAIGMAIAKKIDKRDSRVYCIIGDGESQEGQIWEAAMLAPAKKLDNLTVFQDYNKMQIDGTIEEINALEPLTDKWTAFGWNVYSVDGHNIEAICTAIEKGKEVKDKPTMIVLHTIKGKGAFFAEGKLSCHNMKVSEEDWKKAVEELTKEEV
ncbi:MAG TPA: transketolase [Thermotogota bacterium]|nr:transketolase [Thermotogota bacterium]HPJ87567.1 transketolase [Thermotogota bacterium]HPR94772.1 transketolase [Thermotogota bacterium]